MFKFLRRIFYGVIKDSKHNYHKRGCILIHNNFTVVKNCAGQKVYRSHIKYCPCCGEKLDGT